MQTIKYNGVSVKYDDSFSLEEVKELTDNEKGLWWTELDHKALGYLTITRDGEEICLHGKEAPPIERIRKITGYLSPVNKWNNAKIGELRDRMKHGV